MNIEIREFHKGAEDARGFTVIIDVFRAFSLACYAFDGGISKYILAGSVDEAFKLKDQFPEAILVGERDERMIPGFELGNSPTQILTSDIKGKSIIHCTTAGTRGLSLAQGASTIVTGSLVNAAAVARYAVKQKPGIISLVAMGYRGESRADEDYICAMYIKSLLEGGTYSCEEPVNQLRTTSGARFFLKDNLSFSPPTDYYLCTMVDRFNFILAALKVPGGHIELIKVPV